MFNLIPWKKKTSPARRETMDEQTGNLAPYTGSPLARLREEFDALFDRFLGRWPARFEEPGSLGAWWGLDMEDNDQEIVVKAEVPGFEPGDLDVQVSGNLLTIKAEKRQESNGQKGQRWHEERYSKFQRSVSLPSGTDPDQIDARYHNGLLEVHVRKSEEARAKRIAVKS